MVNMSNTYDHLSDSDLSDSTGQPIFTSSSLKPLRGENGRSITITSREILKF